MEPTNTNQQIDEMAAESAKYVMLCADSLKALLRSYSEDTTIGKIIRLLLRWERGEISTEGHRLFRGIIMFHGACALQEIYAFVTHDLLDDGGVGLVVRENGVRTFVYSDDTISNDVVLAEMERADYAYRKAQAMFEANIVRRAINFCEGKSLPVPQELRDKLAALEAT